VVTEVPQSSKEWYTPESSMLRKREAAATFITRPDKVLENAVVYRSHIAVG